MRDSAFQFKTLTPDKLDSFVEWVDRNGGPEAELPAEYGTIQYQPRFKVDQSLDPLSEEYCKQQFELYKEISGRTEIDQAKTELTEFQLEDHVSTVNAYASEDPARLSMHYGRLAKLIRLANLKPGARVLDMGCGWGLSSEFFSAMGCHVTAVDINERFVELIRRRSKRLGLEIEAINSGFDNFSSDKTFDLVVFYESLHHALRPMALLQKLVTRLNPEGKIAMAGEPIQAIWWNDWGLRLDPLSIYCIRKFGWFESGWSRQFILSALRKCGLRPEYVDDGDPAIGPIILATQGGGKEIVQIESTAAVATPNNLHTSEKTVRSLSQKIAGRTSLLKRGAFLILQAFSCSFLFRK